MFRTDAQTPAVPAQSGLPPRRRRRYPDRPDEHPRAAPSRGRLALPDHLPERL